MFKKTIVGVLAIGAIVASCNNDDDAGSPSVNSDLTLELSGLEALGTGYVYEGWIVVPGETVPVSTGVFTSVTFPQTYAVDKEQLDSATAFVLTIEPAGETGEAAAAPSNTKLLKADFGTTNIANVGVDPISIEGDFADAAGNFFLRAPTDEALGTVNNGNDENGVWFGLPGTPPVASLVLPKLDTGWKYEGWVVDGKELISTGTFTMVNTADDNAGAADGFSETAFDGPPLPGEDFFRNAPEGVTFPLDVRGKAVIISVEPFPDDSAAPFVLKPLSGIAGMDTAPANYPFEYSSSTFPSGTVTR